MFVSSSDEFIFKELILLRDYYARKRKWYLYLFSQLLLKTKQILGPPNLKFILHSFEKRLFSKG